MSDINKSPQITVLMAVYNGSLYLRTAIESILEQTYRDFEFLIVDDASSDDTVEIVKSYDDNRINLISLCRNIGQTAALNIGLHQSTTPWIARMDADDYSAPTRLEKQMDALRADPSIACVGTHVWIFSDDPGTIDGAFSTPLKHAEIKYALLRGSPIVHGTILVKRSALLDVGGYDERYRLTQDLELYDRLVPRYKTANIPSKLVGIRQHTNQASQSRLANEEALEICSRRLMTNNYSRNEEAIIRSTLCRAFLFRARFSRKDHEYIEFWKNLARGFRISPNSFFWNFCSIFLFDRFSSTRQIILRRVLTRSAPKYLKGR